MFMTHVATKAMGMPGVWDAICSHLISKGYAATVAMLI